MSEDIIRKIAKLLETADSFAEIGNQEAADSYIGKAMELQTKYNIDQAMLAARGDKNAADTITQVTVQMSGGFGRRRIHLAHYIAVANDCTGYFSRRHPTKKVTLTEDSWAVRQGRKQAGDVVEESDWDAPQVYCYTIFGFSRDVEWTKTLCERLNGHLDLCYARDSKSRPSWESHKTWGTVYVENYASAVSSKLNAAKREARKQAEQAERERVEKLTANAATAAEAAAIVDAAKDTSVALVLVDKRKKVQEEYRARHGRGRSSSTSSGFSSSAANAGRAAGASANIGRSVGGGSGGALGR